MVPFLQIPTLASAGPQVAKEEVISRQQSRGIKRKTHIIPKNHAEIVLYYIYYICLFESRTAYMAVL